MNRQGKSRLNDLLTQLGIQPTTKIGMEVDKVWVDEMLEEQPRDLIGTHISHIPFNIGKATEEQAVLLKKIAQDSAKLMIEQLDKQ